MIRALAFAAALNVCVGGPDLDESEAIKSLNEVKNLQMVGDFISIVPKNTTTLNTEGFDAFNDYIHSHLIRIKVPFLQNKYFNFELKSLVPDDLAEGRKKKRMGLRDILVPLLLAIKYKATLLTMLMVFVTILALKGFWAGMTGLFISKLVALKVFLQSQNKSDENYEEDEGDNHEHSDHHEIPYHATDEEEHEDKAEPIVIYLNSDRHSRKFLRRRQDQQYYYPKTWNPWERQQVLYKTKWERSPENWEEPSGIKIKI